MLRRLLPQGHVPEFTDPSGKIVLAEMPVSPRLGRAPAGRPRGTPPGAGSPTSPGSATGCIPGPDTVFQEGDLIHIALKREDLAVAERVLDAPPPAH